MTIETLYNQSRNQPLKATIEEVIAEYERLGFDANQDFPGNFLWEELYTALSKKDKNIKVILTVRDNDQVWWNSWCNFMKQEAHRAAIFGISLQG